jgi:hypothetical protein
MEAKVVCKSVLRWSSMIKYTNDFEALSRKFGYRRCLPVEHINTNHSNTLSLMVEKNAVQPLVYNWRRRASNIQGWLKFVFLPSLVPNKDNKFGAGRSKEASPWAILGEAQKPFSRKRVLVGKLTEQASLSFEFGVHILELEVAPWAHDFIPEPLFISK